MESNPSKARTIAAVALYLVAGMVAVVWKFSRRSMAEGQLVPDRILAVVPNLVPAIFVPMVLFISKRVVRFPDYLRVVVAILVALCVYEFAQLWMPKRAFDWADIAASVAGSCIGCLVGWLVFFRCLGSSAPGELTKDDKYERGA